MLYPLKFKPQFKTRIWGGNRLQTLLGKRVRGREQVGESWEISGLPGDVSVVSNGLLAGNTLQELIEVYLGDLVGEKVYEQYGAEFPVLVKWIDAADLLSIQVHPDDPLARERHGAYGKSELWYVVACDPGASLYLGFNGPVTQGQYQAAVTGGRLPELLQRVSVHPGSAYYIPAGTIHALGAGILLVEIQQTSDITYRVWDWERVDATGHPRELHPELAESAIGFGAPQAYDITPAGDPQPSLLLKNTPHFVTELLVVNGDLERDFVAWDSFVVYVCVEGTVEVTCAGGQEWLRPGETVLIPAELTYTHFKGSARLIEIHMP